jgi:hypothetical protein
MPQAGFEPATPANERPQTHAVGRAAATPEPTCFIFLIIIFTSRNISDVIIVILSEMTSSGTGENIQKKKKKKEKILDF